MRALKILLLIPVLGYLGIKAYIWVGVKSQMDELVASVEPFAEITYGSIYSSMSGEFGIENLVIRPKMVQDQVSVGKLGFAAKDISALFGLGEKLKNKESPEYMALTVEKFRFDLNGEFASMLDRAQDQMGKQEPPTLIERLDAMGCGNVNTFAIKDYRGMGYEQLELTAFLEMEVQEHLNQTKIALKLRDSNLYKIKASMTLSNDSPFISAAGPAEPAIREMNVFIKDTGYYKLRNEYCARQVGGSESKYIEANVRALKRALGGAYQDKTVDAYRQFVKEGGTIELKMTPSEATVLSGLRFYKTSEVVSMLKLQATVNDVPVDLIKRTQMQADLSDGAGEDSEIKSGYQSVGKAELHKYSGRKVKVEMSGGRLKRGVLLSASADNIEIRVKLRGGEFTFPIEMAEVKDIKVFF